jgi:hypothetical protein
LHRHRRQRLLQAPGCGAKLQLFVGDASGHLLDGGKFERLAQEGALADLLIDRRATKVPACGTTSTSPSAASRATASDTGLRDTPSGRRFRACAGFRRGDRQIDRIAWLAGLA